MTDVGPASPRRAEPRDVAGIELLVRDAYGHYVERIGMPPLPMVDDYPRRVAAGQAWVLDGPDALVGLVVLVEATDHLYVDNVAVAPSWQGTGSAVSCSTSRRSAREHSASRSCGWPRTS